MPKLISCLGLNKSVCPKTEYMIQRKTFHFETALESIWKDIFLSYCLIISVLTSLFSVMAMDPRGLHFSAMKCEFSCVDWNTKGDVSQSGSSMSLEIQTHLIAGLASQVEWYHISFVLLFPQTLKFTETLTDATLPLSTSFMQCSHKEEERSPGTYCWQRSNKQSCVEEWGRDRCIPCCAGTSWTICHRDVLHSNRDIFSKHPQTLNSPSL